MKTFKNEIHPKIEVIGGERVTRSLKKICFNKKILININYACVCIRRK